MSRNRSPPSSPRRRTYQTGQTLPVLTDSYRPIPLGRDENGDPDGQVRAFTVAIRNRSDRTVYVKEGEDADEAAIDRFESYTIWEPNGVNEVLLRGEQGGELLEIRTLEAHNDFGIKDRIDAFIRSISHILQSSKQETTITGAETVIPIQGDVSVTNDTLNVTGNVEANVTGDVNVTNDTLNVGGSVEIGAVSDTAVFETNITGSDVTQNVDIESQSVGDISVLDRTGRTVRRTLQESFNTSNNQRWTLYDGVDFDGLIQRYTVRIYTSRAEDYDNLDETVVDLQIQEAGELIPEGATPTEFLSAENIYRNVKSGTAEGQLNVYDRRFQVSWTYEPTDPIVFSKGDTVSFAVFHPSQPDKTTKIEIHVQITERIGEN